MLGFSSLQFNFFGFIPIWDVIVDALPYHPRYSPSGMKDSLPQALGVLPQTALRASALRGLHQLNRVTLSRGTPPWVEVSPSLGGGPANSGQLPRVMLLLSACWGRLSSLQLSPSPFFSLVLSPSLAFPSPGAHPKTLPTKPLALDSPPRSWNPP